MAKFSFSSPLVRGAWFILAVVATLLPQTQQLLAWALMVGVVAAGILLLRLRVSTVLFVGAAISVRRLQLDDIFTGMVVASLIGVWALISRLPMMDNAWRMKVGFVAAVVLGAAVVVWPTANMLSNGKIPLPRYVRDRVPMVLAKGLDLQGGMRLVYQVEVEEAIGEKRNNIAAEMGQDLAIAFGFSKEQGRVEEKRKLEEKVKVDLPESALVRIRFADKNDRAKLDDRFQKKFTAEMSFILGPKDNEATFKIRQDVETNIRERAVTQAKETVFRRVDELGLREAAVTSRDEDIIVEVPGQNKQAFDDIKEIIRRTARLEFKMEDTSDFFAPPKVDPNTIPATERIEIRQDSIPDGLKEKNEKKYTTIHFAQITKLDTESMEECKKRFRAWIDTLGVPDDRQVGFGIVPDPDDVNKEIGWRTYYLFRRAEVTGEHITNAEANPNQDKQGYSVSLTFNPVGSERFEEVTGANINRRFAIILDDKVDSAPVIQSKIGGGHAQISMGAGDQDTQLLNARKLERVLRSGALPAQISQKSETTIGPSLGRDAIDQGLKGMVVGTALVLLFMFIYYRTAGLVADGAVLLNLFLQLAILASFGATMTLPGIAGLALTIGIAIDANVLINERIREEMRTGRSIRAAIDAGYDKAFTAIIDGHVTVAISGLILMQYGSGPVKGFAVTLFIGILASLFTGVFCTRLVFDWWARGAKVKRLNIGAEF